MKTETVRKTVGIYAAGYRTGGGHTLSEWFEAKEKALRNREVQKYMKLVPKGLADKMEY